MGGVKGAHISSQARRTRRGRVSLCWIKVPSYFEKPNFLTISICQAASMSITSVLCLKDQVSIATAGAVDRLVGKITY